MSSMEFLSLMDNTYLVMDLSVGLVCLARLFASFIFFVPQASSLQTSTGTALQVNQHIYPGFLCTRTKVHM